MEGIRAITVDLDGTLWDIDSVMRQAERSMQEVLAARYPRAAQSHPPERQREVRARVGEEHPELAHDFTTLRRLTFERMLSDSGYSSSGAGELMDRFFELRNNVALFPDVLPALKIMSAHFPLVALTNGNADVRRIGLAGVFTAAVHARAVGALKPDQRMFAAARDSVRVPAANVLHVGDHPVEDIDGARRAGMRTAWINRNARRWPQRDDPDLTISSLEELVATLGLS